MNFIFFSWRMEGEAGGFMDERERESGKKYKRVISNILVLQILAVVHFVLITNYSYLFQLYTKYYNIFYQTYASR